MRARRRRSRPRCSTISSQARVAGVEHARLVRQHHHHQRGDSATRVRRVGESDVNVNAMASENRIAWIVPGGYRKCSKPGGSSRVPVASRTTSSSVGHDADPGYRQIAERRRTPRSRPRWRGPHREQQLVVVAAGEGAADRVGPGCGVPGSSLVDERQRGRVDARCPTPEARAICRTPSARPSLRSMQLDAARLFASSRPARTRGSGRR